MVRSDVIALILCKGVQFNPRSIDTDPFVSFVFKPVARVLGILFRATRAF